MSEALDGPGNGFLMRSISEGGARLMAAMRTDQVRSFGDLQSEGLLQPIAEDEEEVKQTNLAYSCTRRLTMRNLSEFVEKQYEKDLEGLRSLN